MNRKNWPRAPFKRVQGGFSLIELMVALVLGLLVLGAALAVFRSNQITYSANEGQNRIQENARVAHELMSRDIRAAGGSACNGKSLVQTTNTLSLVYRDTPVTGTANELTVTSGEDNSYRTTSASPTSVTIDSTQLPDATQLFHVNDWILLCNSRNTFLVQATGVTADTVSFAALPGNYDLDADPIVDRASVVIARLRSVRWFVADNGRGGQSLFVSRFGGAREEVAEGVSNLSVQYLDTAGGPYKTTGTGVNWTSVAAVRIGMTLSADQVDGKSLNRTASNVVNVRSRSL